MLYFISMSVFCVVQEFSEVRSSNVHNMVPTMFHNLVPAQFHGIASMHLHENQ